MKFRLVKLGHGGLDKRGFGFQYLSAMKVLYVRLWFFAVYLSAGIDIVADFQRMHAEKEADQFIRTTFNRHQRRAMMAKARHARTR